ncbi:MAG TPA: DUF1802 family protein, partial [Bryobacteraceae bacterium]|nr:DUF1802 family protein [Bryobacteraceae bacterium]
RGFEVRHTAFLLFPTFEHQHASFIRSDAQDLFQRAQALHQPGKLRIELCADAADVFTAPADPSRLLSAAPLHIWNERYIQQRYEYRPDLPLNVILPRARRLPKPAILPMRPSYAGCKSWVNLTEDIDVSGALPVLSDDEFAAARESVMDALSLHPA